MQDLKIYENSYLIIGGPNTKKSEVSLKLSKKLGYKLINLDRDKHSYFGDFTDFDSEKYYKLLDNDQEKAINYIHKYEMLHLEYILNNINENIIIDFGNTYTLINDINILNKLKLFKNVVLLIPSDDIVNNYSVIDKKLYKNKINYELATIVIEIKNRASDLIVKDILNYKKFKEIL